MLTGAVDVVLGGRVAGWAYDSSDPARHLTIIVSTRHGEIARGTANILRPDLAGSVGDGDHSFRIQIPENLTQADIEVAATYGEDVIVLHRLRTAPRETKDHVKTVEERLSAIETRLDATEVFLMRLDEMTRKIIDAENKKRKRWLGIF